MTVNPTMILTAAVLAVVLALGSGWVTRRLLLLVAPRRLAAVFATLPITAAFGLLIVGIYIFVALFAPVLAPFAEREIVGTQFMPWDDTFILGTDSLGRDLLSRLIYGARNTVGIAFLITLLAFLVGATLGMLAATVGGWLDEALSRIVDVLMAIPSLIFALLLLTILGTSIFTLIVVIAAIDATRVFRLARAVAQDVVVMDYIEAARLRGEKLPRIIFREILPNTMAPLVAEFGLRFCFAFLMISALSFLGVGIQPPTADWGSMVRENAALITFGEVTPLLPAIAIALLTVAVNFVVDWQLHRASGLKD